MLHMLKRNVGRKISQYLLVSPFQRRDGNQFDSCQFIHSSSAKPQMNIRRPSDLNFGLKRRTGVSPENVAINNPMKISNRAGRIATNKAEDAEEGDSGTVRNEAR